MKKRVVEGVDRRSDRPRVLVIEDDIDIAALVAYQLTKEGYRVETAASGSEGLTSLYRDIPDLVVLDRMLPDVSGDDVLKAVRREPATRAVPVLVLTAKRERGERIEGLEMGADDYLVKPFSTRELVLRVDAILRRARGQAGAAAGPGGPVLTAGDLRVNLGAMRVTFRGSEVRVTPTELRLLRVLLERRGRTLSRRQLLERAWGPEHGVRDRVRTRTVDMHIRRLRSKLGSAGDQIETVRGFGYRFRAGGQ